jgi:DNA-binding transcriptional LysR family regulator
VTCLAKGDAAVDLSDLIIFKTVAEEGGIVKAARRLHRVQSNVTTRIKQLEASVGAELFFRRGQRIHLSEKGAVLLDYAQRLLAVADEARAAMRDGEVRGTVKLGALESTTASRLADLLSKYHKRYPDVAVQLRTGTNDFLVREVVERRLDAAFIAEAPSHPMLSQVPLFREVLVVITAKTHRRVTRPGDVAGDSVIAFPTGCAYRRVIERWLGDHGLAAVRVMELSSYHAIVACVASGAGIAVVPESVLDIVPCDGISRHRLPRHLGHVVTPLVWRTGEQSAGVAALSDLARRREREVPVNVSSPMRPTPRGPTALAPARSRTRACDIGR